MNKVIKEIFEKYNKEVIASTEVSRFLHENNLVQKKSGADIILESINLDLTDEGFNSLIDVNRIVYLQALSSYNELDKELSFSDYINRCLKAPQTKIRFERLSNNSQEKFWNLVNTIQTKI